MSSTTLPIPGRPWASIEMDFFSGFSKMNEMSSVLVVEDRFTKYAIFIPAPATCTVKKAVELFLRHIMKFFGSP